MNKFIHTFDLFLSESYEKDYLSWKRKNISLRGIKDIYKEGDGMAKYGSGLYTTPLSNRSMAKQYGEIYFLLNAIPKKPKFVYNTNEAEIFLQELVTKYCKENGVRRDNYYFSEHTTISKEMLKLGYDGLIIKGREMVNYFPPDNVIYFNNEDQVYNYYIHKQKNT